MRLMLPVIAALALAPAFAAPAHADPYRWCAEYGGFRGGGHTSCYFKTFQQCQASVSGVGGFCRQNTFFDGRPVRTPEDGPVRRQSRS